MENARRFRLSSLSTKAKAAVVGAVLVVGGTVGGLVAADGASAAHSIVATAANPVYWQCHNNKTGTVTGLRKYDGTGSYPACGSAYTIFYWHQGENALPQVTTWTAQTAVSDRDDSGLHGNWAKDAMIRTLTLNFQHSVPASNCGPNADQCYFYKYTLTDQGNFRTTDGALSPNAGTPIAGNVSGTFNGGASGEFYADSASPNASLVPATATGDSPATSKWAEQFFAAGTNFASENLPAYTWTYSAQATCEQYSETFKGSSGPETDTGDIQGVNHCA